MKFILPVFLLLAGAVASAQNPGCVLGPLPGDHSVRLSNGKKIDFPACWSAPNISVVQGYVPAETIQPMLTPFGLYTLGAPGLAIVHVAAAQYTSSPVGPYREVFIETWASRNPAVTTMTPEVLMSLFHTPGSQPPKDIGLFVIKSYIDADSFRVKANALRLYREVFGYGDLAEIRMSPETRRFEVWKNLRKLFEVNLPAQATDPVFGVTTNYGYDHASIGQKMWSRMATSGVMGQSTNFANGYKFFANPEGKWSRLLSGTNFSSPQQGQNTAYFSVEGKIELHTPVSMNHWP